MDTSQPPSSEELAAAIQRLAIELAEAYPDPANLVIVGIARGGIELGKRLAKSIGERLKHELPYGIVDISFHRDDLSSNPVPNIMSFANLPFDVEGKTIILVDDVIFSGRSIRAALNEIFDQGRPAKVSLAVLVDRGGRALPINPDFTGLMVKANPNQHVKVVVNDNPDTPDTISIAT
ncbi:MAG: bifunctional pyr operon transcriptional regulator/uracil phosphoribosyltransferase PyrR [Verrucomicrobia bacterium]|nr:bifunctional pyr operon transcriptional regulator/uracil phosphoribosyltransferase PyrR [Verrucomicrobiota bacterium]MDA1066069.1 bifunctional pyr operon transcriptional regulator/uracil phosphoribosyltransferase PyrR [Verrucomicrobiota bacterium]